MDTRKGGLTWGQKFTGKFSGARRAPRIFFGGQNRREISSPIIIINRTSTIFDRIKSLSDVYKKDANPINIL